MYGEVKENGGQDGRGRGGAGDVAAGVAMDDGALLECKPGDVSLAPVVIVDFQGMVEHATLPRPRKHWPLLSWITPCFDRDERGAGNSAVPHGQ